MLYMQGIFMSIEKKRGGLSRLTPETKLKLEMCLEQTATDAVDLLTEAYGQDVFDKQGRGDKVWLYKGAKEALTCMEKLNRVLDDSEGAHNEDDRKESAEAAAAKLLERVSEKLSQRKSRPS